MLWFRRLTVSGHAPTLCDPAAMQINNLVWWDRAPGIAIERHVQALPWRSGWPQDVFASWLVSVDVRA